MEHLVAATASNIGQALGKPENRSLGTRAGIILTIVKQILSCMERICQ